MSLDVFHIPWLCIFHHLEEIRNAALISPGNIFAASQCADFSRASCALL